LPSKGHNLGSGPDAGHERLTIELLDNHGCQKLIPQLNDFENSVFGSDFACDSENAQPWIDSGCSFYAAICDQPVNGQLRVLSAVSALVTTSRERQRLLSGDILDYELTPWTQALPLEEPVIYFSSVISEKPNHLAALYQSLLRDLMRFRQAHRLTFNGAFAIASGRAGYRHMARNGFRVLPTQRYLRKYGVMVMDHETAATPFWRELLGATPAFHLEKAVARA
jgi:hypothetical protein